MPPGCGTPTPAGFLAFPPQNKECSRKAGRDLDCPENAGGAIKKLAFFVPVVACLA